MKDRLLLIRLLLMSALVWSAGIPQALAQKVLLRTTHAAKHHIHSHLYLDPDHAAMDGDIVSTKLPNALPSRLTNAGGISHGAILNHANAISGAVLRNAPGPNAQGIVTSAHGTVHSPNGIVLQSAIAAQWAKPIIFWAQSHTGFGVGAFTVLNASLFADPLSPRERAKMATASLKTMSASRGAYALPAVSIRLDKSEIILTGGDNATLLHITLSNATPNAVTQVNLASHLMGPLVIGDGIATSTCTAGRLIAAQGVSAISHRGLTIPPGGCEVTVPVQWPNTDAGRQACLDTPTVTNTITPGIDFVSPTGQVGTPASASLGCQLGTPPTAKAEGVLTLETVKLVLMGLSLVVLAVCAMRKRPGGDWPGR